MVSSNFWSISSYFWSILCPFPHIFDPFPLFSKTLKISFYWSVSWNIRSVSLYFWFVSAFFKNFKNLNLLIGFLNLFPHMFDQFLLFSKTLKFQLIDWFPQILVHFLVFLIHFRSLQKLLLLISFCFFHELKNLLVLISNFFSFCLVLIHSWV